MAKGVLHPTVIHCSEISPAGDGERGKSDTAWARCWAKPSPSLSSSLAPPTWPAFPLGSQGVFEG